jgi:hypothetical protein
MRRPIDQNFPLRGGPVRGATSTAPFTPGSTGTRQSVADSSRQTGQSLIQTLVVRFQAVETDTALLNKLMSDFCSPTMWIGRH